jgi:hypothetical protein
MTLTDARMNMLGNCLRGWSRYDYHRRRLVASPQHRQGNEVPQ